MKQFDWESMKMVQTGNIPPADWNKLIDIIHTISLVSMVGGTLKTVFGVGTTAMIDQASGGSSPLIDIFPYKVIEASDASSGKVIVRPGTHAGNWNAMMPTISSLSLQPPFGSSAPKLTLGTGDKIVYVEIDGTYDALQTLTLINGIISSSTLTSPPPNTVTGGNFSFYQAIAGVTVNPPAIMGGNYSVTINQLIMSSQVIGLCGTALQVGSLD